MTTRHHDDEGILQDGQIGRCSLSMRDALKPPPPSRSRVAMRGMLDTVPPVVLRDGNGRTDTLFHRPGFVMDAYNLDAALAREEMYAAYDREKAGEYRGAVAARDAEGAEGTVCTVKNEEYPDHHGSPGRIRGGVCVPDELLTDARRKKTTARDPKGREAGTYEEEEDLEDALRDAMLADGKMTIDEIARTHRRSMERHYAAYDAEIREQYKVKP